MSKLQDELNAVQEHLDQISEGLHPALSEFIMDEVGRREDLLLAQVVLSAAYPAEDTEIWQARRVHLAAALELLAVALTIHKLLLTDLSSDDTVDKSLAGGTVLAGDLCFSRAAAMAAQTQSPAVVAIFSELLQMVSEGNLRAIVESDEGPQLDKEDDDGVDQLVSHLDGYRPATTQTGPTRGEPASFNETALLYEEGARAGATLAQLSDEMVRNVAAFSRFLAESGEEEKGGLALDGAGNEEMAQWWDQIPGFQRERWRAVLAG